jgi:hypothetical protein
MHPRYGLYLAVASSMFTVSIAELLASGIPIQTDEAIAIALELVAAVNAEPCTAPPSSSPAPLDGARLGLDGSLTYAASNCAPTISELATFLQTILASSGKVPGALRFTIARALRDVVAEPFDSFEDFLRSLARFDPPDRRAALCQLMARYLSADGRDVSVAPIDSAGKVESSPIVSVRVQPSAPRLLQRPSVSRERRRVGRQATALRRDLREADRRLFEQLVARGQRARLVAMPVRSASAASPALHAVPVSAAVEATDTPHQKVTTDVSTARASGQGVIASGGRLSALVMAAVIGMVVATVTLVRPITPKSVLNRVSSLTSSHRNESGGPGLAVPTPRTAALESTGGRRESEPPAQTATRTSTEPSGLDRQPTPAASDSPSRVVTPAAVPRVRDAVTQPRRSLASAAGAGPLATPDNRDDGEIVSALDLQQRPVFSPAFASKESAMFFHTGRNGDARSALKVASPAENGWDLHVMTVLDDGARNYHAQPSPDGTLVAFDSDRDGERGVYVANRNGTAVLRVSGPGYAAVPSWAPDSKHLAYVRAETNHPNVWNLWLSSLDPSRADRGAYLPAQRLTNFAYGQTWAASWFSDGRRICFSHEDTIVTLDLVSGRSQEFKSPVKGGLLRTPAVSPDGTKVIFQVFRHGAWILDLENGSMRCVLTDPSAEEFTWSPDGRRIAFHSRRDGEWGIYVYGGN